MIQADGSRRPLSSRDSRWARALSAGLAARRVRPNAISLASVVFATAGAACVLCSSLTDATLVRAALWVGGAAGVQIRLLCNLLDGMVAIEGGLKSKSGDVYNDLPDRVSDSVILVSCGYAVAGAAGPALGWSAAVLAVFTAYVRLLGASLGLGQDFGGPMAKPHRMAVVTIACFAEAAAGFCIEWRGWPMTAALALIAVGSVATIARRTRRIVRSLEHR
ncbi:MAG: CDP-alcohol phosphatidyltransferase family protein [Planctomycetes bacterium]|nr:CDP-alcohol phosphatidyltransferase family protein [Planctomycetota bacterium]MBI3843923.1 CDP-alcohol phosphatidyltransferase family protein [Planctomycetota bacterium]